MARAGAAVGAAVAVAGSTEGHQGHGAVQEEDAELAVATS